MSKQAATDEAAPGVGHNSVGGIAGDTLKAYIARIEHIEDEIEEHKEDLKELYTEIKSGGFDTKIVRLVIARRKKDKDALAEMETLLDLYLHAIGMKGVME